MAELVCVDDFLSKVLWMHRFLQQQGIDFNNQILQDNKSSILLCEKGCLSSGKHCCTMDVRYFCIKDHIDREEIKMVHYHTDEMIGDFFNKTTAR